MRGGWGSAPNVVEFDYYPWGYFIYAGQYYDSPAAAFPAFNAGNDPYIISPNLVSPYNFELPTNQLIHVTMAFTASNQTVFTTITTNGILVQLPDLVLNSTNNSNFGDSDDYRVDVFSISSYSSIGAYESSVLAHGIVSNLVVTVPPPPVQNFTGNPAGHLWQGQFTSRTNWLYTLESSTNLTTWTNASSTVSGNDGALLLSDPNPPAGNAFYRVRADRP
jgi:hypothetical protein